VASFLLLWSTWTALDLLIYSLPPYLSLAVCATVSVFAGRVVVVHAIAEGPPAEQHAVTTVESC